MTALFEQFVLTYLAAAAVCAAAVTYIGSRTLSSRSRGVSSTALKDLLANDYFEAVSILVPAYNSEDTVVDTVHSLLNLQHPQFDIIVVNDGSTDDTLERLVASFSLVEVPIAHDGGFDTQHLNVMYRSIDHANLTVIDKDHGGRDDALNAALNLARRPLVCVVDADVVLDPLALAATSRRFVEDETVVAVAGLVGLDEPVGTSDRSRWTQRFQMIDGARRAATAAGWSALGAAIDSEGFVIYRRRSLLDIGGWSAPRDTETLLALHRLNRARKHPYRVVFTSQSVGHMQPEPRIGGLIRRRGRRLGGLAVALWGERRMLFRARYGRMGLASIPARWLFDVGSVVVEASGYAYIALAAATGSLETSFAIAFALLAPGSRVVVGQLAVAADAFTTGAHPRTGDRIGVFVATVVEQIGIAQLSIVECVRTLVRPRPAEPVEDVIGEPIIQRVAG